MQRPVKPGPAGRPAVCPSLPAGAGAHVRGLDARRGPEHIVRRCAASARDGGRLGAANDRRRFRRRWACSGVCAAGRIALHVALAIAGKAWAGRAPSPWRSFG